MDPRSHDGVFEGEASQPRPKREGAAPLGEDPLGPFAPPADYEIEPELQGPTPRPMSAVLYQGRHAQSRRKAAWGFLVASPVLLAGSFLPFMKTLALYLLPLAYLDWAGFGCLVTAMGF